MRPVLIQQPQVVLDTTALENTFDNMGQSMLQLARVQDQTNRHLQQHIQQGQVNMQAHTGALHDLANSTQQRNYDHIFASIPVYDGSNREDFFPWLDRLEAACYHCGWDIKTEALGRSAGPVQNVIMALPQNKPWSAIREELKHCFSDQISLGHTASQLENLTQKPNEPLRLYIYRYSKLHKAVTQKDATQDTDPSRWFRFLTSITNTSIADKVTRSKTLPHNLQQCFEKALEYEASFQLSEGVNMARKTTIMNVNVENEEEVNLVRDARARSNACYKCGEMGHFQHDCQYDGDKPSSDKTPLKQATTDANDPVVGKWMTNLVATTPVTAKAMQSLLLELHKQRELKRAYRRHYRDIQTTSTSTATTSQPLTSVASINTKKNQTPAKTTGSQVKKPVMKGKVAKSQDKNKKRVAFSTTSTPTATTSTSPVSLPSLRNKLRDKAKVTVAMIQELTEDLQSIDQDSILEESESVITQESDLEQEDSEDYMTDPEDQ